MAKAKSKYISTIIQIENLKPADARYEVADATLRRNRLVVFPSGAKSWVHRYRFGGRTRKLTLECGATDLARARQLGAAAMNALAANIDPGAEKQERKRAGAAMTVGGLIDRYLDDRVYKRTQKKGVPLRSAAEIERILRREMSALMNRAADGGIASHEARKLIEDVTRRGHFIGNRTLGHCKALFGFAKRQGLASASPFDGLERLEEASRERVLVARELRAVWKAAEKLDQPIVAITRLLLLTGCRLGEIEGLRWSEINFDKRQLELPGNRVKNGRGHIVPLSEPAMAILEKLTRGKGEGVFDVKIGPRVRKALSKAVATELSEEPERWTLHDLRRTAATRMAEDLKIAPHVVDKILNHSSGVVRGVAAVYIRGEYLDERRAALEAWGRLVNAIVHGEPARNVVALRG
jgi:integrase